jgi:NitT/TauT family transport system substrate-binding protein
MTGTARFPVRIGEPYHVVYYAPLHVANLGGFFRREGLDAHIVPAPSFAAAASAMQSGAMDVAVGGIMRSLVAFNRGEPDVLVHFARVNDRDGFLLLGRSPAFDWPDLLGRRLIVFAEAPTPLYVLRAQLLSKGLDPDRLQPVSDVPIGEVAAAFRRGAADFALTQAHVAEDLIRSGDAVLLRAMGDEAGPLPYSSYYCSPDYLSREHETVRRVARAHAAAMRWMRGHSGEEIWETIAPAFAGEDASLLRAATHRYKSLGTWDSSITLPRSSYTRLADALRRGGLTVRVPPYELVCDDIVAREAEARLAAE